MDTLETQKAVAQAVIDRGYREEWTAKEYAARQVLKLVEELAELFYWFDFYGKYRSSYKGKDAHDEAGDEATRLKLDFVATCGLGYRARWAFDAGAAGFTSPFDTTKWIREEMADMQVVLFNLAEAVSEIDGDMFDIARAALDKAKGDIKRGVRGED